ncbi:FecR family protein [Pontibacter mucosus]|uniref:FecR family protein n=1 Tax=Pontibacter mucosus TaxID=1649266 RepID=A0A2T5YEG3_9BACT|nr:FecR domain-containing protein [Pontibacter mucosus]PTX15065.1 FecR family protein [Pontibacter mucosus]
MDKEKFLELVDRYLAGKASAEEERLLFRLYEKFQERGEGWDSAQMGEESEVRERIHGRISEEIKRRQRKQVFSPLRLGVAATLLIAFLSTVLMLYVRQSKDMPVVAQVAAPDTVRDTSPDGSKATLTLADGSEIILDDAAEGELAKQPGVRISKAADGQLVYAVVGPASGNVVTEANAYNAIKTPKGGQYQVVLPDGSKVWLNAASSLRYPARFTGLQRRVELTGEAYFEVEKNADMPFVVESRGQVVEVLGTHFNIDAYADEAFISTTLLEGAVRVSADRASSPQLLAPGQQALVSQASSAVLVRQVDIDEAVAWKSGYFMFNDEDLESIMRELARWYDVQVEYQGDVGSIKFGGVVSRSKTITQTLRVLELASNVRFKVEGKKVIVMP